MPPLPETLLEDILREMKQAAYFPDEECFDDGRALEVLKRRLLPLLEAGEAMANEHRLRQDWKQRAENWRAASAFRKKK